MSLESTLLKRLVSTFILALKMLERKKNVCNNKSDAHVITKDKFTFTMSFKFSTLNKKFSYCWERRPCDAKACQGLLK